MTKTELLRWHELMKKYKVTIHPAPLEYIIEAENEEEAMRKAENIYTPQPNVDIYKLEAEPST